MFAAWSVIDKCCGLRLSVGEVFEEGGGDVGGGDGADALDLDDEAAVAFDALDVTDAPFEGSLDHPHFAAGTEGHVAAGKIFESLLSATRHEYEGLHLGVGDDDEPAVERIAVKCAVDVDGECLAALYLKKLCCARSHKHQPTYGWSAYFLGGAPFAGAETDGHRHVGLQSHLIEDGFGGKYFITVYA